MLLTRRDQYASVHPIRWLYLLQRVPDLRHPQPSFIWVLPPVLPPKLQTTLVQVELFNHWSFYAASLTSLFILLFAVFSAGGPAVPFASWWRNNVNSNYHFCPMAE
jgi:hypothetical protein